MRDYSYDEVDLATRSQQWQSAVVCRIGLLKDRNALSETLASESDYVRHAANAAELRDSIRVLDDLLKSLALVAIELDALEVTIASAVTGFD